MDDLIKKLQTELDSLRISLQDIPLSVEGIKQNKLSQQKLQAIQMFSGRALELLKQAEQQNILPATQKMTDPLVGKEEEEVSDQTKLGEKATIKFINLNKEIDGKVDTGATTSSLHATNVSMQGNSVSFKCEHLSPNTITMDLAGHQDVHTSDNEEKKETRAVVQFDVEINGQTLKNVIFNLNDRSHMDSPILIGQNILKQGNFVVDVSNDTKPNKEVNDQDNDENNNNQLTKENVVYPDQVKNALEVLKENNITFKDVMMYLKTEAVKQIEY